MKRNVAVVDYGMGNLRSVAQAVRHAAHDLDVDVQVTSDPAVVLAADRVVLPGQGAMRDCMLELERSGMREAILTVAATRPLMGVCVGMQMMLDHSDEQDTPGLGLLPGNVKRFDLEGQLQSDGSRYKVPQMGWNQVEQVGAHAMWAGIPDNAWFYFVHSYACAPSAPHHSVGVTEYGERFTSALARDNIFATQFHPEKSADHGLALYRNFLRWQP